MPITLLDAADFSRIPALQFAMPIVTVDPGGYQAGLIYNSTEQLVKYHNGTAWVGLVSVGTAIPPSGNAGGDLSGTYPNPQIAAGVIVDADVAAANKDGAAATPSMRTLGTGANQAAPGNDSRFGAASPPNGAASGDLTGTYPGPQIAALAVTDAKVAAANKDGAVAVPSMRTLGSGGFQALAGNTPLNMVATATGPVNLNNNRITNLADPTNPQDGANKNYVDLFMQGFTFKNAVRLVATSNITLSGLTAIDGVTPVANDRILCVAQTTQSNNGIWVAASGAWVRSTDTDGIGEIKDGTLVPVAEGTANADSHWICTSTGTIPWQPDFSVSTWTKFMSLTDLQAGNGLTKSGATINFVGDATLSVAADQVSVVSAPKWTTARSLTLTGDVTGTTPSVDGSGNISIATTVVSAGKRFAGDVGSGTSVVITHNLNTTDLHVSVYRKTTPFDVIQCGIEMTTVNTVTLKFATAVAAAAYRCVVIG